MYRRIMATLIILASLALGFSQQTGGGNAASGGNEGSDVGNVADNGLILITTRDPGSYIATAEGVALYTLVSENGEILPCNAECLGAWPAYTGEAKVDKGTGLNADLAGTAQTEDGQEIVTYNDYPLYSFSGDQNPSDVTGQGVEGFGGYWYVIGEDGEPIVQEETTAE